MSKFNPFALRPQQQGASVSREFQRPDEIGGEVPFTLTFRPLTEPEKGMAQDLRDTLVRRYLGDVDNGVDPEMEFPPLDGGIIPMSMTLTQNAAFMEIMQPNDAVEKYSCLDFIAMSATLRPVVWQQILLFCNEVGAEKSGPNSPRSGS
jgi:hypothetical protein